MLRINNCLSVQDLDYIQSLPDVLLAKEKLADFTDHGAVYFKITLTDSLKSTLSTCLDLDLSNITEIPMRWIKGDTMRHKDKGKSEFTNTYLVYLTDSSGEFVLGDTAFPIQKNTGFVFNEGILHETMNTGLMPRLLLGPMNEFAEPVGDRILTAIYYFSTQAEAETASVTDDLNILAENSVGVSSSYLVGNQNAMFFLAYGVAVDASGNIFVADTSNYRIRKVTPSGIVTTLAGSGNFGYLDATSGPGTAAMFSMIIGIAVDTSGNVFVADSSNRRIRKVSPSGAVSTLAGGVTGDDAYSDGQGINARFNSPYGMAVDASGNIFVADTFNNVIRKLSPPTGLTWDSSGAVIYANNGGGIVTTIAGTRTGGFTDGTGASASFSRPSGMAFDASGNLIVADIDNNCIRRVTPQGDVSTITDSNAAVAVFNSPRGVAVDASGNIFVSEFQSHRIQKITPGGVVSTLAGSGSGGFADAPLGPGSAASLYGPQGIVADTSGNVFVADGYNSRIRKIVTATELVTTYAGGDPGYKDNNIPLPSTHWKIASSSTGSSSQVVVWNAGQSLDAPDTYFLYPTTIETSLPIYYFSTQFEAETASVTDDLNTLAANSLSVSSSYIVGSQTTQVALPTIHWKIAYSSTGTSPRVFIWEPGYILNQSGTYFLYPAPPGSVCFLEGTTVLCFSEGKEQYLQVEKLTKGTLVKTLRDGYKKVELIAKEDMVNPGTDERIEQRLYKCSTSRYPELTSDLYITGCHSILVNTITNDERDKLMKHLGRVFVTDKKYRLIACVDERAEPWNSEGTYTIWHFALENEDIKMNYGVFVNGGLLVESCSKHVLKNKSDMLLL